MVTESKFTEQLKKQLELFKKKNHDYGGAFDQCFDLFGPMYPVPRLYEKVLRISSLLSKEQQVEDESIVDTLRDIAVLATLALIKIEENGNTNEVTSSEDKDA